MPYITQEQRKKYEDVEREIYDLDIETKGDLEYLIFMLMKQYMTTREARYSTLHDATYGCIHAGEEFRRRFLDKREDTAREENGDV